MKYSSGEQVKVGDRVRLWQGCTGHVVCSIDADNYTDEFPEDQWSYLKAGVLIRTDSSSLIHLIEADEDLELISRET